MSDHALVLSARQVSLPGLDRLPKLFRDAGEHASRRLIEFFTVTIRNRNTREAYGRAVRNFGFCPSSSRDNARGKWLAPEVEG